MVAGATYMLVATVWPRRISCTGLWNMAEGEAALEVFCIARQTAT